MAKIKILDYSIGGYVPVGLLCAVIALFADQVSKYFVALNIETGSPVVYGDYFNMIKVWNTGVSFSMFNNYGLTGTIVLCVVSFVVCGFLLYWLYHETDKIKQIALGFIIGGAIGNVIDRIRFGAVLDFLDFHYQAHHWPAFNLADSFICVGAFILILLEIKNEKKKGIKE